MKEKRRDDRLETLVNRGLAAAYLADVAHGIRIMSGGGVSPEVISRVFFNPRQRRSTDWKRQ